MICSAGWPRIAAATLGLWGLPTAEEGWLQPVNGFYRLTRATYAQFGLPLPYPERSIDTVLAHSRDRRFFHLDVLNACNVLDVVHPLWLCRKQSDYRQTEIRAWAEKLLGEVLPFWGSRTRLRLSAVPAAGDRPARHGNVAKHHLSAG